MQTLRVAMFVSSSLVNSRPQIEKVLTGIAQHAAKHHAELRVLCGNNDRGPDGFISSAIEGLRKTGLAATVGRFSGFWTKNGPGFDAAQDRVNRMLDACPAYVVAMWDGKSAATKYAIDESRKRGLQVTLVDVPLQGTRQSVRQARVSMPVQLPAALASMPELSGIAPIEAFDAPQPPTTPKPARAKKQVA